MKKIAPAKELFSRAWLNLKATWRIVLPLAALIQAAAYVFDRLIGLLPDLAGSLLSIVGSALVMVPMTGLLSGVLGQLRRKNLTYDCIHSMLPHAWKVIGVYLWTMLCLFGWMLPGMGGMIVGGVMMVLAQKLPLLGIFGGLLMLAGMVLIVILACQAVHSYAMSNCVLIDAPDTPVRAVLKRSKEMMHGYRWHYFKVGLPVFLGIIVITLVIGGLSTALPLWLTSLLFLPLNVAVSAMSQFTLGVMYGELKRIGR